MGEPLQIQMLGEFSIQNGENVINDSDNRSKKVWLLLAYMIYCRNKPSTPEDLIALLWGENERSSNPMNALKTMFHRVRSSLNLLGENAGHDLIVRREGSYAWNTDIPIRVDIDVFEALCRAGSAAGSDEKRLTNWRQALELYQGDFLSQLSSESWVVPISTYYHNLYVQTMQSTLSILESQGCWDEVISLCRRALVHEPYLEEFYRQLMNALLRVGDQRGAVAVYEEMSQLFLANFGVMPAEETLALYREAVRTVNDKTVSSGIILEQLRENEDEGQRGAFFCDYDVFRSIYHSVARSIGRSGDAVHLALFSVMAEDGSALPRRSLDRVMMNLQDLLCSSLRRGDTVARCSVSQFVLLLPQADFENSCMVCDRLVRAFTRQFPHSPASLRVSVHPLSPNA